MADSLAKGAGPNLICIDADGDCFEANGTPGCDNTCGGVRCKIDCCKNVCHIDPFCCEFEWDANCADEAMDACTIPAHDTCDEAQHQDMPSGGGTIVFTGNNQGAGGGINDCAALNADEVWISFSIPPGEKMNVELDYCDSPDFFDVAFIVLTTECPCDDLIFGEGDDRFCKSGNPHRIFNCLEGGETGTTYYYPIFSEPGSEGDYVITVNAVPADIESCPGCPMTQCFDDDTCILRQSFSNFNEVGTVACGAGAYTTPNGFARCFDLEEEGVTGNLTIEHVQFGVNQFDADDPMLEIPIQVNIYEVDACGNPVEYDPETLISSDTLKVSKDDVGSYIDVVMANPPKIAVDKTILIEIWAPMNGTEKPLHAFRPMANYLGQCGPSYLRAPLCGLPDWWHCDAICFPGPHTWITATGTQSEPMCAIYGDITSTEGVCIPDGNGLTSDVTFDDVLCALDGMMSPSVCPCADITGGAGDPCTPNGVIDFDDVLAVVDAFAGEAECPDSCGA